MNDELTAKFNLQTNKFVIVVPKNLQGLMLKINEKNTLFISPELSQEPDSFHEEDYFSALEQIQIREEFAEFLFMFCDKVDNITKLNDFSFVNCKTNDRDYFTALKLESKDEILLVKHNDRRHAMYPTHASLTNCKQKCIISSMELVDFFESKKDDKCI